MKDNDESSCSSMIFDKPKLERLKQRIKESHEHGRDEFVFDGVPLLTRYAEYMVMYLEEKLK